MYGLMVRIEKVGVKSREHQKKDVVTISRRRIRHEKYCDRMRRKSKAKKTI